MAGRRLQSGGVNLHLNDAVAHALHAAYDDIGGEYVGSGWRAGKSSTNGIRQRVELSPRSDDVRLVARELETKLWRAKAA